MEITVPWLDIVISKHPDYGNLLLKMLRNHEKLLAFFGRFL